MSLTTSATPGSEHRVNPLSDPPSPVISLLPEILPLIFLEVIQGSPKDKTSALLVISRVSWLWRNISLSTPELWAWIDTADVGVIRTFIARAKNRPLSVFLRNIEPDKPQSIDVVLKSLDNMRSLQLSIDYKWDWNRMGPFLEMNRPAPLLESLFLNGIDLPGTPFSGSLPSLRDLHLIVYDCEWENLPKCPQIRSLEISQPDIRVRVPDFLQRLATFPLLEEIDISYTFDSGSGNTVDPNAAPVKLRHLKYLTLEYDDTAEILQLLRHIRFPNTCNISLSLPGDEANNYLAIFSTLEICRTGTPRHIRQLKVVADDWLALVIHEGAQRPKTSLDAHGDLDIDMCPPSVDGNHTSARLAAQICQEYLDLTRLESLDLLTPHKEGYPINQFWGFLDSITTLRVLKVRRVYAETFIRFISTALDSANRKLPFAAVHKLVYEEMGEWSPRLKVLERYLGLRGKKGLGLKTLTLVQVGKNPSQIPSDILEDLGGVVQELKRKIKTSTTVLDKAKLLME